jgi:DHA1 family multidrug resistance protein B-like MFS transporter
VLAAQGMAAIYLVFGALIIMQYRVILSRRSPRVDADVPVSA